MKEIIKSSSDSILVDNNIYISGGTNDFYSGLNCLFKFEMKSKSTTTLANLLYPTGRHASVYSNLSIYVIGGFHKVPSHNLCQRYVISKDKWFAVPDLTEPKNSVSASNFNFRFIYCFGGNCGTYISNRIERLSIFYEFKGWEILKYETNGDWGRNSLMASLAISNYEILVFGGKENHAYNSYMYSSRKNEIENTETQLPYDETFIMRKPILYKQNVYIFGLVKHMIYTYSFKTHKWSTIPTPEDFLKSK